MVGDGLTRAAGGEIPIEEWGLRFPSRLNSREWNAFELARESGFAVSSFRRPNLRNVWWGWCQGHHIPYVMVVRGYARYAWIEINLLSLPAELSTAAIRRLRVLLQRYPRLGARMSCYGPYAFRTQLVLREAVSTASRALEVIAEDRSVPPARSRVPTTIIAGPWDSPLP